MIEQPEQPIATLQHPTGGWEPRGEYMLLEPIELAERSEGGIYIPSQVYRKTQRGHILARGPQCTDDIPLHAEVFFPQNTDWEIEIGKGSDKKKIYIVKESDIILWREEKAQ